jgi:hypothetical protein
MDTIEITSLDDDGIAAGVNRWLAETELLGDSTLGAWLVEEAWVDWKYQPAQLVGETVGLAIGASSDMYDFDPEDLLLFTVTQVDADGNTYTLNWIDSDFYRADTDLETGRNIRLIVDHFNDAAGPDTDSQSSELPLITIDTTTLAPLFAGDPLACVPVELVGQRIVALAEQVTRVLVHLREHVLKLPITIASA